MNTLLFVDTNIYLDSYRIEGDHVDTSLLDKLIENHDKIISTFIVDMEFKKNRQAVIVGAMSKVKIPQEIGKGIPSFLRDSRSKKAIEKRIQESSKSFRAIKAKVDKILENPKKSDQIYQRVGVYPIT